MKDSIVQVGDPVLRAKASPVAKADLGSPALSKILKKMSTALAKEGFGVAIAAPQIGESLRIFVIAGKAFKDSDDEEAPVPPDMVFINPEITKLSRAKKEMSEGCLSVRHKYGSVVRHEKASVRAWDENGKVFTYNGSGLIGHIFQHEVDHLNGILYIDKAVHVHDDQEWKELKEKRRKGAE